MLEDRQQDKGGKNPGGREGSHLYNWSGSALRSGMRRNGSLTESWREALWAEVQAGLSVGTVHGGDVCPVGASHRLPPIPHPSRQEALVPPAGRLRATVRLTNGNSFPPCLYRNYQGLPSTSGL